MVTEKWEITIEEYNSVKGNVESMHKLAMAKAIDVDYHPNGYGVFNAKAVEENNKCYIMWERFNSCD